MNAWQKVSVIIIFLDAERFLAEAIASVLRQTYPNIELILVDDGSTDMSSTLARRAAASHAHVTYIEHPDHVNRGMSASRNAGLLAATGEIVTFLDADDSCHPTHLANLVNDLRASGAPIAWGPATYWFSWAGADVARADFVQQMGVAAGVHAGGPELAQHLIVHSDMTPCHSASIIRRDFIQGLGGFETSFSGMYEDQVFAVKAALKGPVAVLAATGFLYRQHEASACATSFRSGSHDEARVRFLSWCRDYAREQGHLTRPLAATIERELRAARRPGSVYGRMRRWVGRRLRQMGAR